jgi:hypothetical protein
MVRVTKHPTAEWLAQQIVEAFPWDTAPRYLIRDNDGAYGQAFTNRVRRMGQYPEDQYLGDRTKPARTWDWPKTHRDDALSNDTETSSQRQFCAGAGHLS